MQATLVDISNYAMKWYSLHLEEKVWNLTVKINTEKWVSNMAIYNAVWLYISDKLENNPEYILKYIEQFRNSFVKYQSNNQSKELTISMGNFIIDTIFNAIIKSLTQWDDLFNITIEWYEQTETINKEESEYDAYLDILEQFSKEKKIEPEPVSIAWVTFKPEPTSSNEEVPKKKLLSEQQERPNLEQIKQQQVANQPKQEWQKVSKMNMSLPWEDEIIDVEIAVVSWTPKIDPSYARAMPHARRVSK